MKKTIPYRIRCGLLVAVCVVLSVQGCKSDTPESLIASGKMFLDKRDVPAAVIQFKNALQKAPNSAEARYLLGVALQQADDPGSAEIELRKALSAGHAPEIVYPALVRALLAQGKFDKALSESEAQQRAGPANEELLALAGDAQLGLGKPQEARLAYSAVLAVQPLNETALLGMAKMAVLEHDLPRAQQLVDEVLGRAPASWEAMLLKGDLLLVDKREKEAAQAYAKVIELRPQSVRVYLSLVPLLLRGQDLNGARARVEALRKFAPRAPLTFYLDALVAYAQGDQPRASDAIQRVLNAMPDYVPALLFAGRIAYDSGSYAQAEEHLRKVVGAAPNATYPRRLLVSAYLRSGQAELAEEALDTLLQLAPNDVMSLTLAGEVALANREVAKAAQYYEKALSLDPKSAMARTRLARAHLAGGDTPRAIEDLEAASATDAKQFQADVALVVIYLSRKQLDKAQDAVDALTKKQPDNPLTYNLLGAIRLAKKDQAGARIDFERALQLQPTYFPAASNLAILDLLDRKPDAAKQRYEAVLAKDAKNEQALLALIELLQLAKAPTSDVEKAIDRAVAANPGSPRPRIIKVNNLLQRGDVKGALAAAQQAQATLPQNLQVLEALGRAQFAAGDYDQAIASFGKLSSLMPKSPAPLLAQAQAYGAAKDWAGARKAIQKALELQPNMVRAWRSLVQAEIRAGRFAEAHSDALAMQKRWPMGAAGYLAEADVLLSQKESDKAEQLLHEAIRKTKNAGLVVGLYSLLNGQGRRQDAETLVSSWVEQNPKDAIVASYAGEVNTGAKEYASAARWYRSALKAQPDDAPTLNNLAWVLGQLHDPSALEYGEKALSLAPNSPNVLDTVGWLCVERGDLTRGVELLNKAHDLAPNVPSIQLNLAKALIKAGQGKAARQQLEVLAKLPSGTPIRNEAEKLLSSL